MGFTDFGKSITSVSYNAQNDIVALDDVQFASGALGTPEASTWAMLMLGFAGLSFAGYRTRRAAAAIV